ncbi:MAG: hypothetical protein KKE23_03035 [Nanoarchaeota archaeon]|nr:hypothetical protein [Nanoarchaeota archaeon]
MNYSFTTSLDQKIKLGEKGIVFLKPGIEIIGGKVRNAPSSEGMSYTAAVVSRDNHTLTLDMPPMDGMIRRYTIQMQKKKIEDIKYN